MLQKSIDRRTNEQESLLRTELQPKIDNLRKKYKCLYDKKIHIRFPRLLLFNISQKNEGPNTGNISFPFSDYYKNYANRKQGKNNKRKHSDIVRAKYPDIILNPFHYADCFQIDYNHYDFVYRHKSIPYQASSQVKRREEKRREEKRNL